ncbi:MAG: hypothetical protein JWO73_740 [Candidatus Taylorbacteria bacterium]|nr:hypothetical protein [Candidatus Taylorbacteria bacterium]
MSSNSGDTIIRLSFANTTNRDQFYPVRVEIGDDFFLLEKIGSDGSGARSIQKYIFLDNREFEFFKEHSAGSGIEAVALEPLITEAKATPEAPSIGLGMRLAIVILQKYGAGQPGASIEVPNYFPLDMADYLRSKGIVLNVTKPFRPERQLKNDAEIAAIEASIKKTQHAYRKIEDILRASKIEAKDGANVLVYQGKILTSEFLKKEVDKVLVEHGMSNVAGIIISCGKDASIAHHPGAGAIRAGETIICDLFPVSTETGYFADMTRTYVKGKPSEKAQQMYDAVLEAQEAALEFAKPGAKIADMHELCCEMFRVRGFHVGDRGFTHSTGHGLGLDLHESPNVSSSSTAAFEVGHVVTVEPGLYYPEHGGVRIEDVIAITKDGSRNLTEYPKVFIIE